MYSGSVENKVFFAATPGGEIRFYSTNPAAFNAFEVGKEYYIDFTPADPADPKPVATSDRGPG